MLEKPVTELEVADLERLYSDSEECDKRIFAEMRTNLQLVAGEHYVREGSKFWNRIRTDKALTTEQRLKLTKNHVQRVTKIYRNAIESFAPGVAMQAANEDELQDQKAAELNQSYWNYIKRSEDIPSKIAVWVKNFVEIGEVGVKIFWDMNGGQIVGYEPLMQLNEESGQQEMVNDPQTGQPQQDQDKPVYSGKLKIETFEAYNLRRDPAARWMNESPYLALGKLLPKNSVATLVTDETLKKKLQDTPTQEYSIFDNNTGQYQVSKDQVLLKEIYFRPSPAIPMGYFYLWTSTAKVAEGKLPYGIFPIVHEGFDEQTGNPRSHSVIRHIRPPQIEINRCASKIAEHQVTLGDDKAYIQQNAKLTQGAMLPGIRVNMYTGAKPEIQPGRSGEQYIPYLEAQINELYVLANLKEILEDQKEGSDMYSNLLRSFRFRKKFAIYGEKFERFLIKVVETSLQIAKKSANPDELVAAFGKSEYINISEFQNSQDICYQIKIEPRSDDIESQFGEQVTLNHMLQYVGPQLDKEDVGQLMSLSPFLNQKTMFTKLTMKWDSAMNMILMLDRGQYPPPHKYDDHKYMIAVLTHRMTKADYDRLPTPVKFMYEHKVSEHEQMEAQNLEEIRRAEAGFIPSGGYLVKCDFYEGDPNNPSKVKRVALPSESVNWLIQALRKQGSEMQVLDKLPQGAQAETAGMLSPAMSGFVGGSDGQGMPGGMNA